MKQIRTSTGPKGWRPFKHEPLNSCLNDTFRLTCNPRDE